MVINYISRFLLHLNREYTDPRNISHIIPAIAIPKITTDFHSLDNTGWYGSAYMLTNCALQPIFGKVYTHFNVKWTYLCSLLVFELGSVLCAAATNPAMLSAGRAVAGAGAAALFNGAMNIISYSVPLRKRSIYIGLLAGMYSIASVVGPILGTYLPFRCVEREGRLN